MTEDAYTLDQVASITEYVDVEAPPPGVSAHFVPGTNQTIPADIIVARYVKGLAPLIIVTGGVNRHTGINEGQEFLRQLVAKGVEAAAIRCEDRSENTGENVEFSLPYLREALALGLPITVVCKWYHRRVIHYLRTLLPGVGSIYTITYEPIYSDIPISRTNWTSHPDGRGRVIREWQEVTRRTADGSLRDLTRVEGAWR